MKLFFVLMVLAFSAVAANEVQTLKMAPAKGMSRAELRYVYTVANPVAVLVLCPGANGDGLGLIRSSAWQDFAVKNKLGLVGLSFASPTLSPNDNEGYYHASQGSGQKLLDGISQIYGQDPPLLLYGFSGGAHFTSRFEQWRPKSVIAWCAFSAGWWDKPLPNDYHSPGIVACGDMDPRYGASIMYFKEGRAKNMPLLWLSIGGIGHVASERLDQFVRTYFTAIINPQFNTSIWVDIDMKIKISSEAAHARPALSAWLPSISLLNEWIELHAP